MNVKILSDLTINELLEIINSPTPKEVYSHLKTSDVIEEFKKRTQLVENIGVEKIEKENIIEVIETFPVEELDVNEISKLTNLDIDKIRKYVLALAESNIVPPEKAFYISSTEMQLQLFLMLQKTNKELLLKIDNLTKTIEKNSDELQSLRLSIDSKTIDDSERIQLKSSIDELEKTLESEKNNLEELKKEKDALIEKYQNQNMQLSTENNNLQKSLDVFKKNHEELIEEKQKAIEELEQKIQEKTNLDIDAEELEKLKNEKNSLVEEKNIIMAASEKEIQDKNKEISLLKEQIEKLESSNSDDSKIEQLKDENKLLSQKVNDLESTLDKMRNENNESEEVTILKDENLKLKNEVNELEKEIEELEKELEDQQSMQQVNKEEPENNKKTRNLRFGNEPKNDAKSQKAKKQKTIVIIVSVSILLLFVSFFIYIFNSIASESVENTQQPQTLGSIEVKTPNLEKLATTMIDNPQKLTNQANNTTIVANPPIENVIPMKEAQTDLSLDKVNTNTVVENNPSIPSSKTNDFVDLSDSQFNKVETIIAKNRDAGTEMLKEVPNKVSLSEIEVQKISSAIRMNVSGFSYENINYIVGNDFFGNKIVYVNDVSKKIFFLNNASKKTFSIVINN